MSRRRVTVLLAAATMAIAAGLFVALPAEKPDAVSQPTPAEPTQAPAGEREAMFYEKFPDGRVQCHICPRTCVIMPGQRGFCRNRENRDGTLYSVVYGKPCTLSIEPIEKAPFNHFLPGQMRLCVATVGCNLTCKYCQNWQISQKPLEEVRYQEIAPADLVAQAKKSGIPIICFTFSEPITFYEYMYDTAKLAHEAGIKTAMVSNGYINPEPLKKLLTVMDAVKIDLKGFTPEFYRDVTGGTLDPVLETLKVVHQSGRHLEIVNLVVPTQNDDPATIRKMCQWIKDNIGVEHAIHFTRFFPMYRMTRLPATPVSTLEGAAKIAREVGLQYVYIGNVPGHEYESTFCPECGKRLIYRVGLNVLENKLQDGKCPYCGHKIPGVWSLDEAAADKVSQGSEGSGSGAGVPPRVRASTCRPWS